MIKKLRVVAIDIRTTTIKDARERISSLIAVRKSFGRLEAGPTGGIGILPVEKTFLELYQGEANKQSK